MATTIGRVDFIVDLDGKKIPIQARAIGAQVGKQMGKSVDSEFQKSLSTYGKRWGNALSKEGDLAGVSFSDALRSKLRTEFDGITRDMADVFGSKNGIDEFVKGFDDASEAVKELRGNLERMRGEVITTKDEQGELTEEYVISTNQINGLNRQLDEYSDNLNRLANEEMERVIVKNKEWQESLDKERQGYFDNKIAMLELKKSLQDLAKEHDSAASSTEHHSEAQFDFNNWVKESAENLKKEKAAHREAKKETDDHASAWKRLSANTRQWTLIIGAVTASLPELATLGSAAGSSLTVLATSLQQLGSAAASGLTVGGAALLQFGIGIGAIVAGFGVLGGDLADLPSELVPVRAAFDGLQDSLSGLADEIAIGIFSDMEDDFVALQGLVTELSPSFAILSAAIGDTFEKLVAGLTSAEGITNLTLLIEGAATTFTNVMDTIIALGGAIGNVFVIAQPFVDSFTAGIADLAEEFLNWTRSTEGVEAIANWFARGKRLMDGFLEGVLDVGRALGNIFTIAGPTAEFFNKQLSLIVDNFADWTESDSGRNELIQWFRNLEKIMPPILDFVTEFGQVIAGAVTPEAVENLVGFFDSLTAFLPFVEQLIEFVNQLNIFGLLAEGLAIFGEALGPLMEMLIPLGDLLNGVIAWGLENMGILINAATIILAPLIASIQTWAQVLSDLYEEYQPVIQAIGDVVQIITDAFLGAMSDATDAGGDVAQSLIDFLPPAEDMVAIIRDQVVPWVQNHLVPAIDDAVGNLEDFWHSIDQDVIPALEGLWKFLSQKVVPFLVDNVPKAIATATAAIKLIGDTFNTITSPISYAIGLVEDFLSLIGQAQSKASQGGGSMNNPTAGFGFASGGVVSGAQYRLTGEAGPEAIVPLNRNLSQVDPSVRALSAIAQGMAYSGGGSGVTVAPGAIVVQEAGNGELTALAVLDRFVTELP